MPQSPFYLRKTLKKNSNTKVFVKQTLEGVALFYQIFAEFGKCYEEFRELCWEAWREEDYKYPHLERSRMKIEVKKFIYKERKNTFIECLPGTTLS